ncbi:MAG: RNA polymerase sigma-70 factor (ECF subfamily) [Planctomycetota bacterium]|jgi:RNA polymerase sigma-70 factor (ECF subfamily)
MDDLKELIERAQAGDRAALDTVFEQYRGRIRSLVRKKLGGQLRNNLESSDVVQSVCLEAMKGLSEMEYRDENGFLHWLARITDNTIRDRHRYFGAKKRRAVNDKSPEDIVGVSQAPAADFTPSRTAGHSEQMDLVLKALRNLPDDYRRIITLIRFEKKTHEEAASIMERSEQATRMLLARARLRLLQELDNGLPGNA